MTEKTLTEQVNAVMATLTQDIHNNKLDIPSPPSLLIKIRSLGADPDSTSKDVADLIKHDINISGRLIKIANCSLFGSRSSVDTVQAAIIRLGQKSVQSLMTGLIIGQQFMQSKMQGLESYCEQAWQSSNNVAALSYVLAKEKSTLDPEQALLAGMVHNIGVLPIILKLNKIQILKDNKKLMTMVADTVIPKLYARAGRLIMTSWNFPVEIINIATEHQKLNSDESDDIDLIDLIQVSYQLDTCKNVEQLPTTFTQSHTFKKFWADSDDTVKNLAELSQAIEQMKHDANH